MKKIVLLLLFSIFIFILSFVQRWPDSNVHIFFCDVGQGDGILITHGFYQLVIDGGPDDKMSLCLQKFMPIGDHTLESVLATHSDSDHITGLIKLFKDYKVKNIYTQAYGKKTDTWEKFRVGVKDAIQSGAAVYQPIAGQKISFDSLLSALILNPRSKKGSLSIFSDRVSETQLSALYIKEAKEFNTTNNEAIALFLTINRVRLALTSDIEYPVELAMLSQSLSEPVSVLKAGHHGSKTSNSSTFLNILRPEAVVISVGKNNRYGHPSPEVIAAFQQRKMQIFRTDQMGTVEMVTDGEKYWWKLHR